MFHENLVLIGTGIRSVGQFTTESMGYARRANNIFHIVEDPVAITTLKDLNPTAHISTLSNHYVEGKPRYETYIAMVETLLESVRSVRLTVAVFYGHPGVMAFPGHEAIRRARAEGFEARMLPAISAEDCLFADLGIDPSTNGCQTFEATDFLWQNRVIEPHCHLILWQIGAVGDLTFSSGRYNLFALPLLVEKLLRWYPPSHEVTVYEAAVMVGCEARIKRLPLGKLSADDVTPRSTLSVPPVASAEADKDMLMRYEELLQHSR